MDEGTLGRQYADGEPICRQGEVGDRLYVMQVGRAVVSREENGVEVVLAELKAGDIFGEMAIFDRGPRSATVRARGRARVLTLDKRGFLKRVHEDPSLAYRILQEMSLRVRGLDEELSRMRLAMTGAWQYLLVVPAEPADHYERVAQDFASNPMVEVVRDRRRGERRQRAQPADGERRQSDRRRLAPPQSGGGLLLVRRPPQE